MKALLQGFSVLALTIFAASVSAATSQQQQTSLLLVGPVEAVHTKEGFSIVLGQKIPAVQLAIGDTVAVFGTTRTDGSLSVTAVQIKGIYVPGATEIFLTGVVQQVDTQLGRAVVSGIPIDLTPTLSNGTLDLFVGDAVQIAGIQPAGRGLVIAAGISGTGISGTGINGGGQPQSISGGGLNGINGGGQPQSISGTGLNGINGGGQASVAR